jgi:hypothetical protein
VLLAQVLPPGLDLLSAMVCAGVVGMTLDRRDAP